MASQGSLHLTGQFRDGQPWSTLVPHRLARSSAVPTLWARERAEWLEPRASHPAVREEFLRLAFHFDLVTSQTGLSLKGGATVTSQGYQPPVGKLAQEILENALAAGASHVHCGPEGVSFRIDGWLYQTSWETAPNLQESLKRLGQGPFQGQTLWVSTCETVQGEKTILEFAPPPLEWSQLGLARSALEEALDQPGLVVVAGLPRSGLGQTLAACAKRLRDRGLNVAMWGERLMVPEGVLCPSRPHQSFRGQDVDAAVVRTDLDHLSRLLIRAEEFSHLVVTVAAPDVTTALRRLSRLHPPPGLVRLVLAQTRLRRSCDHCHQHGCPRCHESGFLGQLTLFEALSLDREIRLYCSSLSEQARQLAELGLTSYEELTRAGLGHLSSR